MTQTSALAGKIVLLIFCNIIWGFIPWPAKELFQIYSSFVVLFARFVIMSCCMFLFILIMFTYQYIKQRRTQQKKSLSFRLLLKYLTNRNQKFYNIQQWLYLLIVAIFGLNSMTILYFWGLKTIGVIVTSIGVICSLILVTAINWGMGKEDMSNFKLLYLITLIGAAIILGIVGIGSSTSEFYGTQAPEVILVLLYGIAIAFFTISASTDQMTPFEYDLLSQNKQYQLIRTVLKLAILSAFAAISLIPIMLGLSFLPGESSIALEAKHFLVELPLFGKIITSWQGIILILVCTTLPYFIYYSLATSWPLYTSFDLWVTTLQLIEPIVNLILGVTVLDEAFPIVWLLVIIFLIVIGIIMRYLSETETQIFVVFLIRIQSKDSFLAMKKLFTLRSVRSVRNIIGNYDLMCEAQLRSATNLNKLIQKHIVTLPGLIKYELLILDMNKSIIR